MAQLERRRDRPDATGADDPRVRVYEERWGASRRVIHHRPHVWRGLAGAIAGGRVLEVGPGLRSTAPVKGSFFVETSRTAAKTLARNGGRALVADGLALPFTDGAFEAVFGFEVLEHVEEDVRMMSEMARVLAGGGIAVVSVPTHMDRWSATDDAVNHVRRYDPKELLDKLASAGLVPQGYTVRGGGGHPTASVFGTRLLSSIPRISNWFLHWAFATQSGILRRVGKVTWTPPGEPVASTVGGMMVLCRKAEPKT